MTYADSGSPARPRRPGRRSLAPLRRAFVALAMLLTIAVLADPARADLLFTNNNPDAVASEPPAETTVTFAAPVLVSRIMTYHWNGARGTAEVGTIGLRDPSGAVHGPWPASGLPGQGGVPNAYWEAYPTVSLPAGTYVVIDSDPRTWAHNPASRGSGITVIEGYPQ